MVPRRSTGAHWADGPALTCICLPHHASLLAWLIALAHHRARPPRPRRYNAHVTMLCKRRQQHRTVVAAVVKAAIPRVDTTPDKARGACVALAPRALVLARTHAGTRASTQSRTPSTHTQTRTRAHSHNSHARTLIARN